MTKEELAQILTTYTGTETKIRGEEVIMRVCSACGNTRWNVEANLKKGIYNCWACSNSGRINDLFDDIGYSGAKVDVSYTPTPKKKKTVVDNVPFPSASIYDKAVGYLEGRGLYIHDIEHYDIRYQPWTEDPDLQPWADRVIFPLKDYFDSGAVVGYQGRTITNVEPKYKISHKFDDYTGYRHRTDIHVLTEGVFDAIKIHKAGFNVGVLLGLGNIDKWIRWASIVQINPKHKIFILLDGSAKKEAWAMRQKLSQITQKCYALKLPEKLDPGDLQPNILKKIITKAHHESK